MNFDPSAHVMLRADWIPFVRSSVRCRVRVRMVGRMHRRAELIRQKGAVWEAAKL